MGNLLGSRELGEKGSDRTFNHPRANNLFCVCVCDSGGPAIPDHVESFE